MHRSIGEWITATATAISAALLFMAFPDYPLYFRVLAALWLTVIFMHVIWVALALPVLLAF